MRPIATTRKKGEYYHACREGFIMECKNCGIPMQKTGTKDLRYKNCINEYQFYCCDKCGAVEYQMIVKNQYCLIK